MPQALNIFQCADGLHRCRSKPLQPSFACPSTARVNAEDPPRPGFIRHGPAVPTSPVVLAVPHAGRDYPAALRASALLPVERLEQLEDRLADRLITDAVAAGATAFVATRPRCWIDLNRDEREIDPAMVEPSPRSEQLLASAKVRGGLGLIPRRVAGGGEILRGRLHLADVRARIIADHRPWHAEIAAALTAACARFGIALLLDCHSMPPINRRGMEEPPRIVLGDRYGRSADTQLVARLSAISEGEGYRTARNNPYAGGYALDRHGQPQRGIHAIQIEIDRSLYLAPDLRSPGPGLPAVTGLVAKMTAAMADELADLSRPEAAE